MTRVGPRKMWEPQGFIEWDDADFLSNDFLESLFSNMRKIQIETSSENNRHVLVDIFSNMRLRLSISWNTENDTCTYKDGELDIMFNNIKCPEEYAWIPRGWGYYEIKWLLDEASAKRIWSIYKKYKKCLNLQIAK